MGFGKTIREEMPAMTISMARATCLAQHGPIVRSVVTEWAREDPPIGLADPCYVDDVELQVESDILGKFARAGITHIGGGGLPVRYAADACQVPPRPPNPTRHLQGAYLRASAEVFYNRPLQHANVETAVRIWSASGPTAGT